MAVEGKDTTEYQATKSASIWSIVEVVIGLVLTVGGAIASTMGADTAGAIVVGAGIAGAGILQNTLVKLGYIKSRTEVKAK